MKKMEAKDRRETFVFAPIIGMISFALFYCGTWWARLEKAGEAPSGLSAYEHLMVLVWYTQPLIFIPMILIGSLGLLFSAFVTGCAIFGYLPRDAKARGVQ